MICRIRTTTSATIAASTAFSTSAASSGVRSSGPRRGQRFHTEKRNTTEGRRESLVSQSESQPCGAKSTLVFEHTGAAQLFVKYGGYEQSPFLHRERSRNFSSAHPLCRGFVAASCGSSY